MDNLLRVLVSLYLWRCTVACIVSAIAHVNDEIWPCPTKLYFCIARSTTKVKREQSNPVAKHITTGDRFRVKYAFSIL